MSSIHEVLERKGRTVLTTQRQASVLEAIGSMSQANIGAIVIEQDGRPVGIFTERDYREKLRWRDALRARPGWMRSCRLR